jgi:hypothetical protein
METIRIPSIIAEKVSPRAREILTKVKKFVEEECKLKNRSLLNSYNTDVA